MSTFPSVLHSLLHLNFLTKLKQIRSHTGSLYALAGNYMRFEVSPIYVHVCECVCSNLSYEGSEFVTAYFTDATGGHGTSRHCRPKVQEHQSPYLNLLSCLDNMWLCLLSAICLARAIHLGFCFIRTSYA